MDSSMDDFQKESAEYLDLLQQLGLKDRDESANKSRVHRRFNFDSPEKTILLQIGDTTCALYDVSIGGLSFKSKNEFGIGKRFELNFDGRFQVEVEIANSFPEEESSGEGNPILQYGARFIHDGDGYRCTRAVLEYFLEIEKVKF